MSFPYHTAERRKFTSGSVSVLIDTLLFIWLNRSYVFSVIIESTRRNVVKKWRKKLGYDFLANFMSNKENMHLNNKNHIYSFYLLIFKFTKLVCQIQMMFLNTENFYWGVELEVLKWPNKKNLFCILGVLILYVVGQLWTKLNVIISVAKNKTTFWS